MDKTISISCIDTMNYEKSIHAIRATVNILKVDKVYWFSDVNIDGMLPVPVHWHKIEKINSENFNDVSSIMHLKVIPEVVDTAFNLIVHYDGFAINKDAWTDEFFNYDYIGACWPTYPINSDVGNGGFSLRSKKLYNALLDSKIKTLTTEYEDDTVRKFGGMIHNGKWVLPEDVIISRVNRPMLEENYGIKFANREIADRWSIEHNFSSSWLGKSFGFHGKHGIQNYYGVKL